MITTPGKLREIAASYRAAALQVEELAGLYESGDNSTVPIRKRTVLRELSRLSDEYRWSVGLNRCDTYRPLVSPVGGRDDPPDDGDDE